MKKKALSVLLALALCLGLSVPAFAAGSVTYQVEGGSITFDKSTGTVTACDKDVTGADIPAAIDGVAVTAIGKEAFYNSAALTRVSIPEGVTVIGERAFSGCSKLTDVILPSTLTVIKNSAFNACWNLPQIKLPNGLTTIESGAFSSCRGLSSVAIPNSVTSLGITAFGNCEKLASISIGTGVTGLDSNVFQNCPELTSVIIPNGVTYIDFGAFDACTGLTSVTIPASVKDITWGAFNRCDALTDVYYSGTPEQWAEIEIGKTSNDALLNAARHYNIPIFTDLAPNAFYQEPVLWAVSKSITQGTSKTAFSPSQNCTHGQILTFLWRAAGSPASSAVTPFEMKGNEYYYGAAKWAFEKGMIGADFAPGASCTRADAVTYIWQAMGKPAASYDGRFTDVASGDACAQAVAWAVEKGVTTGAAADAFNPAGICNRGQIVTFLYRAYTN